MEPRATNRTKLMQEAVERMNRFGSEKRPFLAIIDYEMLRPRVIDLDSLHRLDIEVAINGVSYSPRRVYEMPAGIELTTYPISYERYLAGFTSVHRHFVAGNTYLANLTYPTRIETNLSLSQLYGLSDARYKLRYEKEFTCYSPESFITIENDIIASFPMKGTIDADLPEARETILADDKETAEHVTIVDLIRNDIGMIATRVEVPRFRYIECIETPFKRLLQVSSEIRGRLDSEWRSRVGSILARLLPAGSICGAPKPKTVAVIREAELGPRGYYTGVFGVFDGNRFDSGVMIRFVERTPDGVFYYRSGGGLTVYADPHSEYQEMIDKIYVPATGNYSARKSGVSQSRTTRSEDASVETYPVRN